VAEIGAECQRERGASSALPPLYFLHVWWARRPLIACRAAVVASLLPPETDDKWFLKLLGILGDPVQAQSAIQQARRTAERVSNPYGYDRAFKHIAAEQQLEQLMQKVQEVWGDGPIRMLDPMAGGGSIPFEAMRYGLETYANELNPVAYVILKATLEYPARFGAELVNDIAAYAERVRSEAREKLACFYPKQEGEEVHAYVWARTVKCPGCGLVAPLSPNWWLQKGSPPVAVRVIAPDEGERCSFELLKGNSALRGYDPGEGTVSRGDARCPRCMGTIEGEYIKSEAQAGRMGSQMYALAVKKGKKRDFRLPTAEDIAAVRAAEEELERNLPRWTAQGLVPDEEIPGGHKQDEALRYGFKEWKDLFSPRQLLSHLTYLEAIREVKAELFRNESGERARAIATYLALIFDKCVDYNAYLATWEQSRQIVKHVFQRHDFSFKWSHGEMNLLAEGLGYDWAVDQVTDAYKGLADLAAPGEQLWGKRKPQVHTLVGDAADLPELKEDSIHLICVDPPYYDNVMYAELSDFFYVWEKRTLADVYPEAFGEELTDKDAEAVANPARFEGMKGRRKLAEQDYETKMRNCFERMHEVLRPDGVMTVMFTHKRVEAWDTLAAALIAAGFEITASWPIHTESEHSLHQARKNAAASTILLVCRKRVGEGQGAWWEDIEAELDRTVRERAEYSEKHGIRGVDLCISTFGPALQVISRNWPVRDRTGEHIRPDVALDAARKVVTDYRYRHLLHKYSSDLPACG